MKHLTSMNFAFKLSYKTKNYLNFSAVFVSKYFLRRKKKVNFIVVYKHSQDLNPFGIFIQQNTEIEDFLTNIR